ncbi:hypothetical protein [Streptomyces sp. NPDC049906]|uniref:hypothetical protein n=1 Tax=Streptomyces sp. NPDC049906 TaxID=3155656 RepID=UPI0034155C93
MLTATCVLAFVVNANTSAVSILLPAISEDTGAVHRRALRRGGRRRLAHRPHEAHRGGTR